MDSKDIATAMDQFYEVMNWDRTTGAPTLKTYEDLGLQAVGKELAAKKLVPEAT